MVDILRRLVRIGLCIGLCLLFFTGCIFQPILYIVAGRGQMLTDWSLSKLDKHFD
jgi:hypothetical protein